MSKKKNLEWVCRRCEKRHPEVKAEHSTELLKTCSVCGVENWCFPVTSGRPVKGAKADTNTTDMAPEAESTEENEAVEDAPTEALEGIDTVMVDDTEEPEETPLEAESKPLNEMAKPELLATIKEREIDAAAEIAELEAKLEALKK